MTRSVRSGLEPDRQRLYAVDGLRGVAALLVVLFHLLRNSPQHAVLAETLPGVVQTVLDYGRSGVAVFFVLSGFVIGLTTGNLGYRVVDGLRYSLRRQIRPDPPYYVVVLLVVALAVAEHWVPGLAYRSISISDVTWNLVYLQGFVNAQPLLAVAWTLWLEVQFYLVVVVIHVISGAVTRSEEDRSRVRHLLGVVLAVVSLALPFTGLASGPTFIGGWWMFALGLVLSWLASGRIPAGGAVAAVVACAGWCGAVNLTGRADPWHGEWFSVATALALLSLTRRGGLAWRPPTPWLFLGSISYSLYLVHLPVIDYALGAFFKLTGDSPTFAVAAYLLGLGGAVGAAVALNRVVERTAMSWSRRVRIGPDDCRPARQRRSG